MARIREESGELERRERLGRWSGGWRETGRLGGRRRKETKERREKRMGRSRPGDGEEEVEVSSAKAGRAPGRHTTSSPLCSDSHAAPVSMPLT